MSDRREISRFAYSSCAETKFGREREEEDFGEQVFGEMCIDEEKIARKERTDSLDAYDNCCPKCHVRECNSLRFETIVNATVFMETELQEMIDEGIIENNDENNRVGVRDVVNFKYPHTTQTDKRCVYTLPI